MSEYYVYGVHPVTARLNKSDSFISKLYINSDRVDKRIQAVLQLAEEKQILIDFLSSNQMKQRFPDVSHQGVVACVSKTVEYTENDLDSLLSNSKQPPLILILDGITDPHNLGACLRVADGAGVDFVLLPKDKSANINAVVSKVASGAAESIPVVRVTNLVRTMKMLQQSGVWIYGAAGEATESLYELDCKGSMAIIMGSEGTGLRRLTRESCDGLFSLPMLGCVESLNVSVAAGIALYEVVRQRKFSQ